MQASRLRHFECEILVSKLTAGLLEVDEVLITDLFVVWVGGGGGGGGGGGAYLEVVAVRAVLPHRHLGTVAAVALLFALGQVGVAHVVLELLAFVFLLLCCFM